MEAHIGTKLRALKGGPVTILFWLYILGGQAGRQDLAESSGYSEPSVGTFLKKLKKEDLIRRVSHQNGWILTQGGRQLLLSSPILLPDQDHKKLSTGYPQDNDLSTDFDDLSTETVKFLTFDPNNNDLNIKDSFNLEDIKDIKNSDQTENNLLFDPKDPRTLEEINQIREDLKAAGVWDPSRERIVTAASSTPEYIGAWLSYKKDNPRLSRFVVGSMLKGEPAPEDPNNKESKFVYCPVCCNYHTDGLKCEDPKNGND